MIVAARRLELRLPGCRSLKEKRGRLRGRLERVRGLGVSAAEVADHDLWNVATVGFTTVDAGSAEAQRRLDLAVAVSEDSPEIEVVGDLVEEWRV